ncbi:MAG: hypothetical protein ABFD12_00075 [Syntrophorhabdus sp.]
MGNNYHSPYTGATRYVPVDMNPPMSEIDKALTYLKNVMVGCDGAVTYIPATGQLSWTGIIHIYFNREDGIATHNSIAAGNVILSDGKFAYVTLSETNNAVLTMDTATISPGLASNYLAHNILVFGYRNALDDNFYGNIYSVKQYASESSPGESEIATPAEAIGGVDTLRFITPYTLLYVMSEKPVENVKELIWYSAYGDQVTTAGTHTLTNKTLTSPAINGVVAGGVSSLSGMVISDLMQTVKEIIELIDYTP